MDATLLYDKIHNEEKKNDKPFKAVEFNVRDGFIIMNVLYHDDTFISEEDHHTYRHDADPEILNPDTYERLVQILRDKGVPYTIRNDEFI